MRLGLYGGTFDPVHLGHLLLAESCRELMQLDEVWFIPTGVPPHKPGIAITPGKARREMLELAIAGLPQFQVSRIEIDRPGPHYTVETLKLVREQRPEDELFLLFGRDSLADLPSWRDPVGISALATLVAVNRGERGWTDAANPHSDKFTLRFAPPSADGEPPVAVVDYHSAPDLRLNVRLATMPGVDFSATELRRRVAADRSIRFQTPRAVEQYIRAHRLYRTGGTGETASPPAPSH